MKGADKHSVFSNSSINSDLTNECELISIIEKRKIQNS